MEFFRRVETWVACPECHGMLSGAPASILAYIEAFPDLLPCALCGKKIDWWATVVDALIENFFFIKALELMGSQTTVIVDRVKREVPFELDLQKAEVPPYARILSVNHTPQGPLFLAQVRQHFFSHEEIPHKLWFHPVATVAPESTRTQDTVDSVRVSFMVTWFAPPADSVEWDYLFDAFYAYSVEARNQNFSTRPPNWTNVIIPGNIALELLIGRVTKDALARLDLQAERLEYSRELNLILPLVGRTLNIKPMPPHILETANWLRKLRNDVAHEGEPRSALTRRDAAKLLAGMLFGFHYAEFFRRSLAPRVGGG